MKIGDTVRVKCVPSDLKDDEVMQTLSLFEKCVGGSFAVAGFREVEGMSQRLVELQVGNVLGVEPYIHSIWIEEEFVETEVSG